MSDRIEQDAATAPTRRRLLKLGAIGTVAAVTIKPAFAAEMSVLTCTIRVDKNVDKNGVVVTNQAPNGNTVFAPPPSGEYKGQAVLDYQGGRTLPPGGITQKQLDAHMKYIGNLQRNQAGFTCLASIAGRRFT